MSLIEWDSTYALGLKDVDEHHQHLVSQLNRLYDGIVYNETVDVDDVFIELVEYAKNHFDLEEKLMLDSKYQGYKSHVEKHSEFISNILELQNKYHSGNAYVDTDTMLYLKDWLFNHILKADKKYLRSIQLLQENKIVSVVKLLTQLSQLVIIV
ncbi:MAG: hemerythrin [Geobacter sp.]|nr:MAG: hemerythrin [Geobacter sp.]